MVKQEMARVNINILRINELIWTGMYEFNSDDHYINYCEQESFRRNGVALRVNKRIQNAVLGHNLKKNNLCSFPRQIIQYHNNPIYAPITNAKEGEVEWFYEYLQDLLELIPKNEVLFIICPFHHGMHK